MERQKAASNTFVIGPLKRSTSPNNAPKLTSPRFASSCGSVVHQMDYLSHRIRRLSNASGVDELPEELCSFQILIRCDVATILQLRQTCRMWERKCSTSTLWEQKAYRYFGLSFFRLFDPSTLDRNDWHRLFKEAYVSTCRLSSPSAVFAYTVIAQSEKRSSETSACTPAPAPALYHDGNRAVLLQSDRIQIVPFDSTPASWIALGGVTHALTVQLPFYGASTTVDHKQTVHLWNQETDALRSWDIQAESEPCTILLIQPECNVVAACGATIYSWDLDGSLRHTLRAVEPIVSMQCIDSSTLLTMGASSLTLWNLRIKKSIWTLPVQQPCRWTVAMPRREAPLRLYVATGGMVKIFHVAKTELWKQIDDLPEDPCACFPFEDQVVVCFEHCVQLYSTSAAGPGQLLAEVPTPIYTKAALIVNNFVFLRDDRSVYRINLTGDRMPHLLFQSPSPIVTLSVTLSRCLAILEDHSVIECRFF